MNKETPEKIKINICTYCEIVHRVDPNSDTIGIYAALCKKMCMKKRKKIV